MDDRVSGALEVRPMQSSDVALVVPLHLAAFPDFFLSALGKKFLEAYYSGVISSDDAIAFCAVRSSDQLTGFVAGTANPGGFYSRLLRRDWFKFALAAAPRALANPLLIPRLFRAMTYPGSLPNEVHIAGLYSLAVHPNFGGTGIGKQLVQAFTSEAKRRGCKKVVLTTDADDNPSVNQFYIRVGFAISRQYRTPEDRIMNEYSMNI